MFTQQFGQQKSISDLEKNYNLDDGKTAEIADAKMMDIFLTKTVDEDGEELMEEWDDENENYVDGTESEEQTDSQLEEDEMDEYMKQ